VRPAEPNADRHLTDTSMTPFSPCRLSAEGPTLPPSTSPSRQPETIPH